LMTSTNIARQATLSKLSEYLRWVEVERVGVVDEQRSHRFLQRAFTTLLRVTDGTTQPDRLIVG
jgi:hypothetical protein